MHLNKHMIYYMYLQNLNPYVVINMQMDHSVHVCA